MSRDALVVGINVYQYLPGLNAPARDAEAIAQRLQRQGEFRVHRLPEVINGHQPQVGPNTAVTLRELETALVRLFKPKGRNIPQTALFYFSGHGIQKDAGIQEGYLATSDVNPQVGLYGLSLFWLRRLLQESPVRQRIVLLDCCHSGELLNFLEADPGAYSGTDRLFMAASREYESAFESLESPYSVFTQALLEGLDPDRSSNGLVTNHSLVNWVSCQLKDEIQQPLFESSGSEIVLTRSNRLAQPLVSTVSASSIPCPYQGQAAFDETHADYFFGRELLVRQVREKLQGARLCALVGASGSGKTSLVQAGVIPVLRAEGADHWRIKRITPKSQPLKSLAAAFVDTTASELERAEQLRRAEQFLRDGSAGLAQLMQASLVSTAEICDRSAVAAIPQSPAPNADQRFLLIIDQFEDLFTQCGSPQAERERQQFIDCLLGVLQQGDDRLRILIVLRTDVLHKLTFHRALWQHLEQSLIHVGPMSYEELKATITKPAEKVGCVCEPNLVYSLLLDVVGTPADLALVQQALRDLWERQEIDSATNMPCLTLNAYAEMGGIRGVIQARATAVFKQLTAIEQQVTRRIFLALTQLGEGTEDSRRRILRSELVSPSFPEELIDRVLDKLAAARLVVLDQVSLSHQVWCNPEQESANVSTALRLARKGQSKRPKTFLGHSHFWGLPSDPPKAHPSCQRLPAKSQSTAQPRSSAHPPEPVKAELSTLTESTAEVATHSRAALQTAIVDASHEALIRNWPIVRRWLDEGRDGIRRQRRIERAAREWERAGQLLESTYLLQGHRLRDAEDYLAHHAEDLSALAQRFIQLSQAEVRKTRRENQLMQWTVPCTLLVALALSLSQYRTSLQAQSEEDYQRRISISRQWAAVAQSILQEPDSDPMAALMVSRLAIEQGERTDEAQASLRAALQNLHLQSELRGHQGPMTQVAFSPDQRYIATAGEDGTVRLWAAPQTGIQEPSSVPLQILRTSSEGENAPMNGTAGARSITALSFSPDGKWLAVAAQNTPYLEIWSVETGAIAERLKGLEHPAMEVAFSSDGGWIAARSDTSVVAWTLGVDQPQMHLAYPQGVRSITFSPDATPQLLTAGANGVAHLWALTVASQMDDGNTEVEQKPISVFQHSGPINNAAFSPNGQWIATSGEDGNVRLWQRSTGKLVRLLSQQSVTHPNHLLGHPEPLTPVTQVVFSPDGRLLASTGPNRQVWLWNLNSGQLQARLPIQGYGLEDSSPNRPALIAFSPNSRSLVTVSSYPLNSREASVAYLWDTQTGQQTGALWGHRSAVEALQWSRDSQYIVTAGTDGVARLWSTQLGSELPMLQLAPQAAEWIEFWQPSSGLISPFSLTAHNSEASPPLGEWITMATVEQNGTLQRWRIPTRLIGSVTPRSSETAAAPKPILLGKESQAQGPFLTRFHLMKFPWVRPLRRRRENIPEATPITASPVSLANSRLAIPSRPGSQPDSLQSKWHSVPHRIEQIKLLSSQRVDSRLPSLTAFALSPDGDWAAIANSDGLIQLQPLDAEEKTQAVQIQNFHRPEGLAQNKPSSGPVALVRQLVFSPDGRMLAGISDDLTVRLWDVRSGVLLKSFEGHHATIQQVGFSPDNRQLVTASWDQTARIWDIASGQALRILQHQDVVSSVQFSPDGQRLLTASWDGTARVTDATTGATLVTLVGHQGILADAVFSPDGQQIATAGEDGTVQLWDTRSGAKQASLRPGDGNGIEPIREVSYSPDGQYIAAVTQAGRVYFWTGTWDSLLALARDRSLRQLTAAECSQYLRLTAEECPQLELSPAVP